MWELEQYKWILNQLNRFMKYNKWYDCPEVETHDIVQYATLTEPSQYKIVTVHLQWKAYQRAFSDSEFWKSLTTRHHLKIYKPQSAEPGLQTVLPTIERKHIRQFVLKIEA